MSNDYWQTRRRVLKKGFAVGTGASIAGLGVSDDIVTPVRAAELQDDWTKDDQDPDDSGTLDLTFSQATTTGWYGADWVDGEWRHIFRTESNSSCRTSEGNSAPHIDFQSMSFAAGTTVGFGIEVLDKYHGVQPSPDDVPDTYDHSGLIDGIAQIAVSRIKNIAGFAFTAAKIVDELVPDNQATNDPDWSYQDYFDYSYDHQSDIGMYRWYYPRTTSEESVFDVVCKSGKPSLGADTRTDFTFHIKSDLTPREGRFNDYNTVEKAGTTSAGTQLYQSESGWLIERIPQKKIPSRAPSLPLPSEKIAEHLNRGSQPLYFAHEAPIRLL